MPHDKNGTEIKAGDTVTVEFVVADVQPGTEYCNATLKSVEKMFPGEHKTVLTINTKQSLLVLRALLVLFVLVCLGTSSASADEPSKFYLIDEKVTEQRVANLERETADLKKRVADLEAQLAAKTTSVKGGCDCANCPNCSPKSLAVTVPVAPAPVAPDVRYVQVCENGVCRLVAVSGPGAAAAPAPVTYSALPSGSTCSGGSCPSPAKSGWYPGKWLGR